MLKLPKRFHPDFSRPKVKPTGPVEIDWDNDLTRGLTFAYIPLLSSVFFGATNKSGSYVELVTQGTYALKEGTYVKAKGGQLSGSSVTVMLETLQYGTAENRRLFSIAPFSPESSSNRDLAIVSYSNGGISAELAGVSSGVAGSWSYRNDGRVFVRYNGSNIDLEYTRTTGERHTATATNTASFAGYNGIFVNIAPFWGGNSNLPFKHVLVWDRSLSDAEIKSLSDDPYQILKPANDLYYFVPSGGGGGTTYDVDAAFSQTFGGLAASNAVINASASFAQSFAMSQGGNADFNTYAQAGFSVGAVAQAIASINALADYNITSSTVSTANATVNADAVVNLSSGMVAVGGLSLNAAAAFAVSHAMAADADISIEALADFGISSGILCAAVAQLNADITISVAHSAIAETIAVLNAQANYGISSGLSVTRTVITDAGATFAITSSFTAEGAIQVVGTVTTPDGRSFTITAGNRTLTITAGNRTFTISGD